MSYQNRFLTIKIFTNHFATLHSIFLLCHKIEHHSLGCSA
ncbi:hypothetical protein HPHPH28_1629 [Helicobacter pylori Hp H-28]|nr:hypothetical protein HPHPH28_1629 [Helicobacter pylori Hp H-28]